MAYDTWDTAVTEHVKRQIKAVAFSDRDYINDLVALEGVMLRNKPRQFHQAMQYHSLRKKYPADVNMIKEEINQLRAHNPARLKQLQDLKHQKEQQRLAREREYEEARQRLDAAFLAEELMLWLAAGGRPDR